MYERAISLLRFEAEHVIRPAALAYEAAGDKDAAKRDFEQGEELLEAARVLGRAETEERKGGGR